MTISVWTLRPAIGHAVVSSFHPHFPFDPVRDGEGVCEILVQNVERFGPMDLEDLEDGGTAATGTALWRDVHRELEVDGHEIANDDRRR